MSVATPPGMGLIRGAYGAYGRKSPAVKRLVFKTVPDATTRAAMLKNGEVDVAYMLDAPTALELKRDPTNRLAFSGAIGIPYLDRTSVGYGERVDLGGCRVIKKKKRTL